MDAVRGDLEAETSEEFDGVDGGANRKRPEPGSKRMPFGVPQELPPEPETREHRVDIEKHHAGGNTCIIGRQPATRPDQITVDEGSREAGSLDILRIAPRCDGDLEGSDVARIDTGANQFFEGKRV